ncbi:MAG: beta strand repeat-containing protein, partial [Phycisphaerales bacterium]
GVGPSNLYGAVTSSGAGGVSILTDAIVVNASITSTTGNGTVTLNADNGALTIAAAGDISSSGTVELTASGGIATAGDVTTTGDAVKFNSPTTLTGAVAVNTTSGAASGAGIDFDSTVDGAFGLSLTAGLDGDITFDAALGGSTPLGAVSIASADDVTFGSTVSALSLAQATGSGTTTLNGAGVTTGAAGVDIRNDAIALNAPITTTGAGPVSLEAAAGTLAMAGAGDIVSDGAVSLSASGGIQTAGDVATSGDTVTFGSPVTLTGGVSVSTGPGPGNVTFGSTVGGRHALAIAAGTGAVDLQGVAGVGIGSGSTLSSLTISSASVVDLNAVFVEGAASVTASTRIDLNGGTYHSATGAMSFLGPVALTSATAVTSGLGAGDDITFSGTLNGGFALSLAAGLGDISLGGAVGGSTPLGAVSIASADDVTFGSSVAATSLVQAAGSGTTTLTGAVTTTGGAGVSITNDAVVVHAPITTTSGNGTVTLRALNGMLSIAAAGDIASGGTVDLTGSSGISTGGDVTTTGDAVNFNNAVTLTGAVAISTTSGSAAGNDVSFDGTVDGPFALVVNAGTGGDVTFSGEVGGTAPLASLAVTSAPSTTHVFADVTTTGNQTWSGGVMLENDVTFRATHTQGDIRFDGTIHAATGAESLAVDAGGNVAFGGSIGATTPLASVAVDAGTDPGETIEFGAGVGAVRAGAVELNTARPVSDARVATIVARDGITFITDAFAMGQGHKLTALGDVTIGAAGGARATSVTLGDVTAIGDLRVDADAITMLGRMPGDILTNTGELVTDPAVDYIVQGQVFFSVAPVMGGAFPGFRAEFASASGAVDGSGTLTGYQQFIYAQPITPALVTGPAPPNAILDLRASDTRTVQINPATVIPPGGARVYGLGSAVPDDEESKDGTSGDWDDSSSDGPGSGAPAGGTGSGDTATP